jgi:hypothetical protein
VPPDQPVPPDRLEPHDQPAPPAQGSAVRRPAEWPGAQGVRDKAVRAGQRGRPGAPGAEPIVPSPQRRAPARFSWLGIALLCGAVVVALVVTVGIFLPALGALGEAGARDPANLPARISTCGRDWTKDALNRTFTRDEILARTEAAPIVVATGSAPSCPPEAASSGDADGMATSIYVKLADDAFVAYDLVGAP